MDDEYGIKLTLETSSFNKQVEKIKKQAKSIQKAFDPNDISGMTITGLEKPMKKVKTQAKETAQAMSGVGYVKYDSQLIQNYVDSFYNAKETANKTKQEVKEVNKETKKIGNSKNINNLTKGLDKMTSKIKRFALSLLSIRSIWALVSRASSAYLAQDTALADKLQAAWAGLGAMLAPIIEKIVNILTKGVSYINIFVKALTGVDLLAKASAKSMAKAAKSAKGLNKALAGFDELNNLDSDSSTGNRISNPFASIKNEDLLWADKVKKFGEWAKKNIPIVTTAFATLVFVLQGKFGLASAIGAVVLGTDGLCKIFNEDLTKSVQGLIELLGAAGFIGILTGNSGVAFAIAGVALALFGLNELMNGETSDAIEGIIFLFGGAGLAGVLLGGMNGLSVGLALASVIILLRGFSDLLHSDAATSVKGFIEIVTGTAGLVVALALIKGGVSALLSPLNLVVVGFVAFASGVATVMKNWKNMNTLQKVVSILGLIAVGAATAAVAVGALQSAWSLGIAAAAIVAGTAAIAASVSSANKRARENIPKLSVGTNYVPEDQLAYIHKGEAVVPKKFNSQEYFGRGNEETNSLLEQVIEAINNIEVNPYTTIRDVGQTAVNYINGKARQYGRSVI